MKVRLKAPMKSSRYGIVFPAGMDLLAERDEISIKVFHPEQTDKSIRVADNAIVSDLSSSNK